MTPSPATNRISIVLGTVSGSLRNENAKSTMTWAPSAAAFDRAGNAMSTTSVNETGGNDQDC